MSKRWDLRCSLGGPQYPALHREGLPALGMTSSAAAQSGCEGMACFSLPAAPQLCVTQPFVSRSATQHPGSQGSPEQGGPHPRKMLQ